MNNTPDLFSLSIKSTYAQTIYAIWWTVRNVIRLSSLRRAWWSWCLNTPALTCKCKRRQEWVTEGGRRRTKVTNETDPIHQLPQNLHKRQYCTVPLCRHSITWAALYTAVVLSLIKSDFPKPSCGLIEKKTFFCELKYTKAAHTLRLPHQPLVRTLSCAHALTINNLGFFLATLHAHPWIACSYKFVGAASV